jgi:hypothetical protein
MVKKALAISLALLLRSAAKKGDVSMAHKAANSGFDSGSVARSSQVRVHACAPAKIWLTGAHAACPSMFNQAAQA